MLMFLAMAELTGITSKRRQVDRNMLVAEPSLENTAA